MLVMRVLLGCCMALAVAGPCPAGQVNEAEARQVARSWLSRTAAPDADRVSIVSAEPLWRHGHLLGWVHHLEPEGWVLVPALRELPPVKAYSPTGRFSQEPESLGGLVVDELCSVVDQLVERDLLGAAKLGAAAAHNRSAWQVLLSASPAASSGELVQVGPLLRARWGQAPPYNGYCPSACAHQTVVGCVATAVAQVMHYWRHPAQGMGSHSYLWDGDGCGQRQVTAYLEDPYDWDDMPASIDTSSPLAQRQAVAELCFEVAVAMDSDFGRLNTGALVADAVHVLPAYFGYNVAINRLERTDFGSDAEWFGLFRAQLDLDRPVLLALRGFHDDAPDEIRRHAAVVDGYQVYLGLQLLHLNLGWNGHYDAWYALNDIQVGAVHWDHEKEQHLIRDVFPDPCVTPTAPPAFAAEPAGEGSYWLGWSEVPGADHYELERAGRPDFEDGVELVSSLPSYLLEPEVDAATVLYFRVRAVDYCGIHPLWSPWSEPLSLAVEPRHETLDFVSLLPGMAHTPATGGSRWQSDVVLVNLSGAEADVRLTFRHSGGAVSASVRLADGGSVLWTDAVGTLFAMDSAVVGAVEVASNVPLEVTGRTYSLGSDGSQGQLFLGQRVDDAIRQGESALLPHLVKDDAFRTNIGAVNFADTRCTLRIRLFDASGAPLGRVLSLPVPPAGWAQVDDVFARAGVQECALGYALVEPVGQDCPLWAHASLIDAGTGDPVTIPMMRR